MSAARRQEIERALEAQRWGDAFALAGELWRAQPSLPTASYLASIENRLLPNLAFAERRKVAVLRSVTVEPLVPLLRSEALVHGVGLEIYVGGFNEYAQDIFRADSAPYRFHPDVTILAVQTRDVAPELWEGAADQSPDSLQAAVERVAGLYEGWVKAFREASSSALVIHSLEYPAMPAGGILDAQRPNGQAAAIASANSRLQRMAENYAGVFVLDYESLIARIGKTQWHDERKWLSMRLPFSAAALAPMAREWFRFVCPATGRIAKVLVTDLDNTLWGGVVGEDGIENLQLGTEHPGVAFRNVQRAMLDLSRRGILLAIASKNNCADAMRVFHEHEGMLLRPEHFAATRMNWNDKAQSLREIAAELNVSTSALAFVDDNPAERARIRCEMPEVTVVELPSEPAGFAAALRDEPVFERLMLSDEDRSRTRYYVEQRQRAEAAAGAATLESYYEFLQQEVEIEPVGPGSIARAAQLTQKTNQFNLTTRRYSEQEIQALAGKPGWTVYAARARDRFGDNGVIGIAILRAEGPTAEIDTFLLSCRVIGRGIETALLAHVVAECRAGGVVYLEGRFRPTAKNAPAAGFYRDHGFQPETTGETGALWRIAVAQANIECPGWIKLKSEKPRTLAQYVHI